MSGIGKIFVVLNLVFSLVIVGAAAAYLSKSDEWKTRHDELDQKYKAEKEDWGQLQSDLQASLNNLKEENDTKQNKIDDLTNEVATTGQDLQSEQVASQQLRDDVTKIQGILENFQINLNEVNARNSQLVDQNAQLRTASLDATEKQRQAEENLVRVQGDLQASNEQIESLEVRITSMDEEMVKLSNKLNIAKQQGFDISSIEPMPEIAAHIEEVNNELGFVILSVGSDDQVKKGYTFSVYRGSSYLGEVQVDDVYPDRAAARIKFRVDGAQFRVNDKASTIL